MKKTINYEKDILFKTNIGEICSISLEHDFTVDDGYLRGEFVISGEYKANELSLNKEPFNYKLPLEYELEPTVDLETFSYDVDNFEYNVNEDELSIYIDFGIRYDEKKVEPLIPEISEKEINEEDVEDEFLNREAIEEVKVETIKKEVIEEDIQEDVELPRLSDEDKDIVLNSMVEDDSYITYHVHIVREGESLEVIAAKYNTSVELIKEYNTIETLELKSKLIIPEIENE